MPKETKLRAREANEQQQQQTHTNFYTQKFNVYGVYLCSIGCMCPENEKRENGVTFPNTKRKYTFLLLLTNRTHQCSFYYNATLANRHRFLFLAAHITLALSLSRFCHSIQFAFIYLFHENACFF